MKNAVKSVAHNRCTFSYLKEIWHKKKTWCKTESKHFLDSKSKNCCLTSSSAVKWIHGVWDSFLLIVQNFLESRRAENYSDLINNTLATFQRIGCQMSLKMHIMYSHLYFFSVYLAALNNEYCERFYQNRWNQRQRWCNTMGDYCWFW